MSFSRFSRSQPVINDTAAGVHEMYSAPAVINAAVCNQSNGRMIRNKSHVTANFPSPMPPTEQNLCLILESRERGAQGTIIYNGGELNCAGGSYESINSTTVVNFGGASAESFSNASGGTGLQYQGHRPMGGHSGVGGHNGRHDHAQSAYPYMYLGQPQLDYHQPASQSGYNSKSDYRSRHRNAPNYAMERPSPYPSPRSISRRHSDPQYVKNAVPLNHRRFGNKKRADGRSRPYLGEGEKWSYDDEDKFPTIGQWSRSRGPAFSDTVIWC